MAWTRFNDPWARSQAKEWQSYKVQDYYSGETWQFRRAPVSAPQQQALLTIRGAVTVVHDRSIAESIASALTNALVSNTALPVVVASTHGNGWRSKLLDKKSKRLDAKDKDKDKDKDNYKENDKELDKEKDKEEELEAGPSVDAVSSLLLDHNSIPIEEVEEEADDEDSTLQNSLVQIVSCNEDKLKDAHDELVQNLDHAHAKVSIDRDQDQEDFAQHHFVTTDRQKLADESSCEGHKAHVSKLEVASAMPAIELEWVGALARASESKLKESVEDNFNSASASIIGGMSSLVDAVSKKQTGPEQEAIADEANAEEDQEQTDIVATNPNLISEESSMIRGRVMYTVSFRCMKRHMMFTTLGAESAAMLSLLCVPCEDPDL